MRIGLAPSNQIHNEYLGHPGTEESEVMKRIADAAAVRLVACGHEAKVFHRPGGRPELRAMVADSNTWGSDVLIAPHSNAAAGYELGILTIAYSAARAVWTERLGHLLADKLGVPMRANWVRQGFIVLNSSRCAAAIVELNAHDTRVGADWNLSHIPQMGTALADATLESLGVKPEEPEEPEEEHESLSGLFIGDEQGRMNWKDPLTRSQADILLARLIEQYGLKKETPDPPAPIPGLTLKTPVAGTVGIPSGELTRRLPTVARYDRLKTAESYAKWATAFGLRLDVLWAQMLLETNGLRYGGAVDPVKYPYNFCGLKDSSGTGWAAFPNIEAGVIAHCAHLAAYVFPAHVRAECSRQHDPRHPPDHSGFQRSYGTVAVVGDLGDGAWAEDPGYAAKLVKVWEKGI